MFETATMPDWFLFHRLRGRCFTRKPPAFRDIWEKFVVSSCSNYASMRVYICVRKYVCTYARVSVRVYMGNPLGSAEETQSWNKFFYLSNGLSSAIAFIAQVVPGECACASSWVGPWVSEYVPHNAIYGHMHITWSAHARAQHERAKCACRSARTKYICQSCQMIDHVIMSDRKCVVIRHREAHTLRNKFDCSVK